MGESHDDEVLKALVSALGGTLGKADSKRSALRPAAYRRLYAAPGLPQGLRDRDDALPASPGRQGLALDRTMIPLGLVHHEAERRSEMELISWPGFATSTAGS